MTTKADRSVEVTWTLVGTRDAISPTGFAYTYAWWQSSKVDHAMADRKGRAIGGYAVIERSDLNAVGYAVRWWNGPDAGPCVRTVYELRIDATRNGEKFGALGRSTTYPTLEDAQNAAAHKLAAQRARYMGHVESPARREEPTTMTTKPTDGPARSVLVPVLLGIRAKLCPVVACRVSANLAGVYGADGKLARDATVRVRSAIVSTVGPSFDADWTVRVDLPVGAGPSADLGAAVAALAVLGHCSVLGEPTVYAGELCLSGKLRATRDSYAAVKAAGDVTTTRVVIPAMAAAAGAAAAQANAPAVPTVLVANDLGEVLRFLKDENARPLDTPIARDGTDKGQDLGPLTPENEAILATVREHLAAGRSVLLRGPLGAGKTMIARRVTHHGPPLAAEHIEMVTAIHSAAGLLQPTEGTIRRPPFRAPHHTVSEAGLIGAGNPVRPGEVSLAHGGLLFLDEVTEFRRMCLEAVGLARRERSVTVRGVRMPSVFGLVGATNLCPCGYHGTERCHCTPERIERYHASIPSGMFDVTIDL